MAKMIRTFFFFAAVIGWVLSLIVHLITILEDHGTPKAAWALHAGAIILGGAGMLYTRMDNARAGREEQSSLLSYFRNLVGVVPRWLLVLAVAGFVFGTGSLFMGMSSVEGSTAIRDGQYILHNHGQLIRTLTKEEYDHHEAVEGRLFSAAWISFYGLAAVFLFPYRRGGAAGVPA